MAKVCRVTGKRPMVGHNVSHANNKTHRRFFPNLQEHRYWLESEQRFIKLRLTTRAMRTIDKLGLENVMLKAKLGKAPKVLQAALQAEAPVAAAPATKTKAKAAKRTTKARTTVKKTTAKKTKKEK